MSISESPVAPIGFDGLFLAQPNTGTGQYARHLWHELVASSDDGLGFALLAPPEVGNVGAGPVVRVAPPSTIRQARARKVWWEQRGVVQAARLARSRLVHVPYFSAPLRAPVPVVTTIHDVIPLILPEYGGSPPMRLYLRLVSAAVWRARLILTDSECSRQDIARVLGIPLARIRVIPLGVEERFRPDPSPALAPELRARFGLTGPVIFNGPGLDVRKNVVGLIEAFARALPKLDPATKLIIAGRGHTDNHLLYPPLAPFIERSGIGANVVLTGAISEAEKLAFYQLADLYVFPSRYEGFGLPPLEAMACGTPVIAADCSSLPEVVGTGGVLVDPEPEPLAVAIVALMNDPDQRAELSRRGLAQAARFSWRATAEQTRAAYREVLAGVRQP